MILILLVVIACDVASDAVDFPWWAYLFLFIATLFAE